MRLHGEDICEQIARQHVFRRPGRDNFSRSHNEQPVTKHSRMVQIMQRNDAGDAKLRNKPQEADLVVYVEMVGGFVKDELCR